MGVSRSIGEFRFQHDRLTGQRPPEEMPVYVGLADVLVSPRSSGTNTPLKIYSYLWSGKAIVATDLETHRQVLDETTALLVPPTSGAIADAVVALLKDAGLVKEDCYRLTWTGPKPEAKEVSS